MVLGFLDFVVGDGVAELEGALELEGAAVELVRMGALEDDDTVELWAVLETEDVLVELQGAAEELLLKGALEDDETIQVWAVLETEDVLVELEGTAVVCEELVLMGALEDDDTIQVWAVLEAEDVLWCLVLVLVFLCFVVLVDEASALEVALELEGAAVVCEEPVLKGALEDDDIAEVWIVLETHVVLELEEGTADVCEELVLDGTEVDDTVEV